MLFVFSWSFVLSVALILSNSFSVISGDDYTFKKLGTVLIDGETEVGIMEDYFRYYGVSLSWDGETLAVLSFPKSDGSRSARVYTFDYNFSSWIQKGQDLDGDYEDVDISTNGDVVALGGPWSTGIHTGSTLSFLQPPVFKYNGNTWDNMGDGIAVTEDLTLLALSGNGMVIASSGTNLVVVHQHDGTSWSWLGQGIYTNDWPIGQGIYLNDWPTTGQGIYTDDSPTVALSRLGSVLAIGESNQVRVYEYTAGGNGWEQRGQTLFGTTGLEFLFGYAVSLDDTGTRLAVGAPDHIGRFGVSGSGRVSVFRYSGTAWNTLGSPLHCTEEWQDFGHSLEMSGTGDRIAVGAIDSCYLSTRVALYQYEHGGTWVQKGEDLNAGYGRNLFLGSSSLDVALSGDGTVVAFGALDEFVVTVHEAVPRPAVPRPTVTSPPGSVVYTFDQLGQDIDWLENLEPPNYAIGPRREVEALSISSSGKIVALGETGYMGGNVSVYKLEDDSWVQMGQDIDGDDCSAAIDVGLSGVALSASGKIVAVVCPLFRQVRVYQYNGNKWEELGGVLKVDCGVVSDRDSETQIGNIIALSADGSVLASSSHCASLVQRYDGTAWKALGQQIWSEQGYNIQLLSLSSDGCVLAVAETSIHGTKKNQVRVLKYDDGTGSWIAMGPTFLSKSRFRSVPLSSDGTVVGFGRDALCGSNSVEVFEYNESANSWNPLGRPLYGALHDDDFGTQLDNKYFGTQLDLSSDGHKIVVGFAPLYMFIDEDRLQSYRIDKVAVYQYDVNGGWLQVGDDIAGNLKKKDSVVPVALSGDGTIFASGGPAGYVRVYQLGYTYTYTMSGGASGDPHFKTWSGESYDFHGLCDLVLLKNNDFNSGLGMDIHIRTKKMKHWSFVSNAVLRIGEDILEIRGDPNGKTVGYWINGVEGDKDELTNNAVLPHSISGFPILYRRISSKQHEFTVNLGDDEKTVVKTWKELVRVDIYGATEVNFGRSLGLMGTFGEGLHMGRDGTTVLPDVDDFGQEWQVLASEPLLFHVREGTQAPEKCALPSSTKLRRRLAENTISFEQAMIACAVVDEADRDMCIFDVMATDDVEISEAY